MFFFFFFHVKVVVGYWSRAWQWALQNKTNQRTKDEPPVKSFLGRPLHQRYHKLWQERGALCDGVGI